MYSVLACSPNYLITRPYYTLALLALVGAVHLQINIFDYRAAAGHAINS